MPLSRRGGGRVPVPTTYPEPRGFAQIDLPAAAAIVAVLFPPLSPAAWSLHPSSCPNELKRIGPGLRMHVEQGPPTVATTTAFRT